MYLYRRVVPGLAVYSYIVGDLEAKQALVIDPTRDVDALMIEAKAQGLTITHILETHVHADFISGAVELKKRLGGKPLIVCSGMGGPAWTPKYTDKAVKNGDSVRVGKIKLQALHTPGHTPEEVSWLLFDESKSKESPCGIFSGDFLFVGDVGRPDLLGEKAEKILCRELYQSVFEILPTLPGYLEIYPSHGNGSLCGKAIDGRPSSTLGYEQCYNPSLKQKPFEQWQQQLLHNMPPAPPAFRYLKEVNANGPMPIEDIQRHVRSLSVSQVKKLALEGCILIDTRPKEGFAASHIPGAINIPLGPTLGPWATWLLPYNKTLVLILNDEKDLPEVLTQFYRVGHDHVVGYLQGGLEAWQIAGLELGHLETLSVHDLAKSPHPFVLDVRSQAEWDAGHIKGAHYMQVFQIPGQLEMIPRTGNVAVICRTGHRASIACSLLKRAGYTNVANVLGGMTAWTGAGYPMIKAEG